MTEVAIARPVATHPALARLTLDQGKRGLDSSAGRLVPGLHNSPETLAEYGRVIAELASAASAESVLGKKTTITVDQVLIR